MSLLRKAYNRVFWKSFYFNEKFLKIHALPVHFYTPIPDTSSLQDAQFEKRFSCVGIDWNEAEQLRNLADFTAAYKSEYEPVTNGGLSLVDAFMLYAFIRHSKPKKMVEIGGGNTTWISLKALNKNKAEGHDFKFISIEPYPLKHLEVKDEPNFTMIVKKVQDVPLETFKDCDLLFIDSTHVSKFGSDVNHEILEIVPSLKVGAYVHWHDILFPSDYWKGWVKKNALFWNESYLLQAFMSFNSSFKIQWAAHYMQLDHGEKIQKALPYYKPAHHLMSFWVKRVS